MLLQTLFIVLHIAFAAAYFGLGLPLARWARSVAGYTGEARTALVAQGSRTVRLMGIMLGAAAVCALGAFLTGGGFANYGPAYHAALGLMLVLLGVQFALVAPAWRSLAAGRDAAPRVAMTAGLGQFLWVVLLLLMFWSRIAAATA